MAGIARSRVLPDNVRRFSIHCEINGLIRLEYTTYADIRIEAKLDSIATLLKEHVDKSSHGQQTSSE